MKLRKDQYEVSSDGRTVWVNTAECLIGRFGVVGIDIHRPLAEQSTTGECLYCTHANTTAADWKVFVEKMDELYGVEISETHRPDRIRDAVSSEDSNKSH